MSEPSLLLNKVKEALGNSFWVIVFVVVNGEICQQSRMFGLVSDIVVWHITIEVLLMMLLEFLLNCLDFLVVREVPVCE